MTDEEEPRFTTLKERIAALNQHKNFQAPSPLTPAAQKRPPPLPPRPVWSPTGHVENGYPATNTADTDTHDAVPAPAPAPSVPPRPVRAVSETNSPPLPRRTAQENRPPPLPARKTAPAAPPQLPPRRSFTQIHPDRRNSNDSDASELSAISSLSLSRTKSATPSTTSETQRRRLPPTLDQAKLPPLPPSRRELEEKAKAAANSKPTPEPNGRVSPPQPPSLPPRVPARPARSPAATKADADAEQPPALQTRRLPPPPAAGFQPKPKPKPRSALECGFNPGARRPSPPPSPPPIPLSSRPTAAEIDTALTAPHVLPPSSLTQSCFVCRDFSAPDALAAQHPTSSIPPHARSDPVGYLAHTLCAPFSSLTDKARAIFTWCHHNIDYDVDGFFGKRPIPRGQSPGDTILYGFAVCEGYARVFESIAKRAGLECVVVSGHGKGFSFRPVRAGDPIPEPKLTGHAWNAVRIDGGEWKLVDPCWGAGALRTENGVSRYNRRFAPEFFTMPNRKFAWRHFPSDPRHWFLDDDDGAGPPALTWEAYVLGPARDEPAQWMGAASREGLDPTAFEPMPRRIPVSSTHPRSVIKFRFARLCPHWDPRRNGEGAPLLMALLFNKELLLLDENPDGSGAMGIDVGAGRLGQPGENVVLVAIDTVDGKSARGMTRAEWSAKQGRCGYSFSFLIRWELV
ncbi:hypothetical protein VTJ49DRAFT_1938 [Mycothermus thermophilus]|uniref:Transglutaminase-like domain-containing protein n=1 Tax=Humicola insolens TaxID=85995 RepID=A0ABR3VNG1_HUMIN